MKVWRFYGYGGFRGLFEGWEMFVLKNEGRRKKKKKKFFFWNLIFWEKKNSFFLLMGWHGPCQPSGKIMGFFFFFFKEKKKFQDVVGLVFGQWLQNFFVFSHHIWTNTYKTNKIKAICHTPKFDQLKIFIRILKFYSYFSNQNLCFIFLRIYLFVLKYLNIFIMP